MATRKRTNQKAVPTSELIRRAELQHGLDARKSVYSSIRIGYGVNKATGKVFQFKNTDGNFYTVEDEAAALAILKDIFVKQYPVSAVFEDCIRRTENRHGSKYLYLFYKCNI